MTAKKVAVCAVSVALLIAVQYALSFVAGVELVTVFLLCFCYVFGAYMGMITATGFSLLRCIIYGFNPSVVLLYLIYYNLFSLLFGFLGKRTAPPWLCVVLLAVVAGVSAYFAVAGLPVSIIYLRRVRILLWIIFGISVAILIAYVVLLISNKGRNGREIAAVTTLAAVCTLCFSLLDDVITPLFYGYSLVAARGYFVASLYVMIPQTVCAFISVLLLFRPLVTVVKRINI